MQNNMASQVFPVIHHWVPHLIDAVALAVKLLPSNETAMDIYCFMHYIKLVMVAQQPHHRWQDGELWEKNILCTGWHKSHLTLDI
jgi:hypothetical protein